MDQRVAIAGAGRARRRRLGLVPLLAVAVLLAIPPVSPTGVAAQAHAPIARSPTAAPASGRIASSATAALPGASTMGEPFVDGAALALKMWQAEVASARAAPSPPSPVTAPRPAVAHPAVANGSVSGRIEDLTYGRPVAGALVTVSPAGLTLCAPAPCANATTDATGAFTVPAPAGTVVIAYSADYYISNRTWATVPSGGSVNLGILYLVHDGYATGIIEDNMPSPQPIAGAQLSATSRDGSTSTKPNATSAANGSFVLAVPPVASEVQINSPGNPTRYLENVTYVNVSPYQTVDLGVIHLEGGVNVTATLVDRVTGLPVSNQAPVQLTVCTRRAGFCFPVFLGEHGSHPTAYALPGPSSVRAYAIGYILNDTPVADVPNTHALVDLGTIYLMPVAVIEVSTNLTGGPAPAGPWAPGNVTVYACSLDDEEVSFQITAIGSLLSSPCTPRGVQFPFLSNNNFAIGTTSLIVAPPLRDELFFVPAGEFPIASNALASLTPLFPTSYANVSWVNGTSDRLTYAGSVNLTGGELLSGNVSLPAGTPPGEFTISACSTRITTLCAEGGGAGLAGCPIAPTSFCIAAPPGPVVVTASGAGAGMENRTWVEVSGGCCAQDGHPRDIGWLNLTGGIGSGNLSGTVLGQTGGPGSATIVIPAVLLTVQACPIGPDPVGVPAPACTTGTVDNASGAFNLSAPLGWDKVLFSAPGYQDNWTWVDVTGNNSTGVVQMAPDAVLVGRVVAAAGGPIYSAIVQPCLAGAIAECYNSFATNTFGQYNGTVRGGPLPWGTYEMSVSAPGYAPSWTWTNTTPGAVTFVPDIVLYPVGTGVPRAPLPGRPPVSNASAGAWVDGRVVDARTGYGIPTALVVECPLTGGACLGSIATTTAGGTFNASVVLGLYYLEVTQINYPDVSVYLNVTGVTFVHLGAISMNPDPWVAGRVLIDPWQSLTPVKGIGAPVLVVACGNPPTRCDLAGTSGTDGSFNVSVPSGSYSTLELTGRGIGGFGSADRGFDLGRYTLNVTAPYIELPDTGPSAPQVSIFGAVVGTLVDGSTWNATRAAAQAPCAFCEVIATALQSNQSSYVDAQIGGGGNYTAFLPSDGTSTQVQGTGSSYWRANRTVPGAVAAAAVVAVGPVAPMEFGWITLRVVAASDARALSYAYVTTDAPDPANGTSWSTGTLIRGDGFVNVTAGFGGAVAVQVTSPGYFPRNLTVSVASARTSALGNVSVVGGAPPSVIWINSSAQNDVGIPPAPSVVDAVTGAAIPFVVVTATNPSGGSSAPTQTNGLGQFLFYDYVASSLVVQMAIPGYDTTDLYHNTTNVYQLTLNRTPLVGNGVVAGRVVSQPGNRPVYDALVQVCPFGNICQNYAYTNATGVFWVEASRGFDTVTITDDVYLTNYTVNLNVGSDTWQWVGDVPVFSFAGISGSVRGIPIGAPIPNANVSVCSPFGSPTGPCGIWVPTDANGSFFVPAPPGNYILSFAAPGYNTSYLPLSLYPGENLSVGTIFLFSDGTILGTVVSAINGAPVANATLVACATYRATDCSGYANTTSSGAFLLLAPPGPVVLTASAAGYFDNFTTVYVPSGEVVSIPPVTMAPLAADIPESVSGTVRGGGVALVGAFVVALQGSVTVASTATDGSGSFYLPLRWGTYTIVAGAPGFVTARSLEVVHANLTGLSFSLEVQTYEVSGLVRDAVSGAPIGGVAILLAGSVLSTSDANGSYALALANGSYDLTAAPPTGSGATYGSLTFRVVVQAGPVVRNLQLSLSAVAVVGEVVDALSGLPIVGATVVATAPGSSTALATAAVAASGSFAFSLAAGSYVLTASAPGYTTTSIDVTVSNASTPVSIALVPIGAGGAPGPSFTGYLPLVAVGIVAAAVVVALLLRRRTPPPPAPPRWTLEDLDEPVDR